MNNHYQQFLDIYKKTNKMQTNHFFDFFEFRHKKHLNQLLLTNET